MRLLNRHFNKCVAGHRKLFLWHLHQLKWKTYDSDHEVSDQVTTEPRRVTRIRTTSEWYSNPILEVMLLDHDEPTNYEVAMMSPDSAKWLEAMKSEMRSIYENKVWTLVDLPDDRQAIENKWIFKKKTDADGNVTIYEARLVAKSISASSRS